MTEVYHVDETGKEQGVVFCEMQGRENSQADLKDMHLNAMVFPDSGYARNSGGLTKEIATLTNDEVSPEYSSVW